LWQSDENNFENNGFQKENLINLEDEALKLFMLNNFQTQSNNKDFKSYYDDTAFQTNNTLNDSIRSSMLDENIIDDEYDLNTYIRLNSKLISEITNLENKLKTCRTNGSCGIY